MTWQACIASSYNLLSPKLQLSALELFVQSQRQSACLQCPECLRPLPTTTTIAGTSHGPLVAVLQHVLDHMTGKAKILEVAKKGRPFAVSASMLGHYFDLHSCDRWLFRSARRTEAGREEDLESMFDAFRHANRTRGNDLEDWLCERLGSPGLPVAWSACVSDAAAPEGAIWTTSSGSGAAASSSGGGVGGGSGGLDIAADPAHVRFLTEEEWAREAAAKGDAWPPPGVGRLIDVKRRAYRACGVPSGVRGPVQKLSMQLTFLWHYMLAIRDPSPNDRRALTHALTTHAHARFSVHSM